MPDNLKDQLIRLGSTNPELRPHLKLVLDTLNNRSSADTTVANEQKRLLRRLDDAAREHGVSGNLKLDIDQIAMRTANDDFFKRGDRWGGPLNRTIYPSRHYPQLERRLGGPQTAAVFQYFDRAHEVYMMYNTILSDANLL